MTNKLKQSVSVDRLGWTKDSSITLIRSLPIFHRSLTVPAGGSSRLMPQSKTKANWQRLRRYLTYLSELMIDVEFLQQVLPPVLCSLLFQASHIQLPDSRSPPFSLGSPCSFEQAILG